VGKLVGGDVPSQRAVQLVKQRGIDFSPDEEYMQTLRVAGAAEALLAELRNAGALVTGELLVVSSPNAEVFLDGESRGHANARGELATKAKFGTHTLKVSLAGKKDFEQSIKLVAQQATKIEARLEGVNPPTGEMQGIRLPNISTQMPTILSDTRGVDFAPYLTRIVPIVRRNWISVIPESARLGEKGRVGVVFEILKDGSVPQLRMVSSSGSDPLDRAAVNGIHASVPFPPLPQAFTGNHLVLQFIFLYNLPPQ